MALQKQPVAINFAQGLQTKSDPNQIAPGQFLALENTTFSKTNLLKKRNGYGTLTAIGADCNFVTTYNGNLTAIGSNFNAYSSGSDTWVSKGNFKPVSLEVDALVRSNTNQSAPDSVVASNGLVCTVYTDTGSSETYRYVISDSTTGQNIISPTVLTVSSGTVMAGLRVFLLGNYFIIVYGNNISGTKHLQFTAISITDPTNVSVNTDISDSYATTGAPSFDGVVANNVLYVMWNGADGGGAIRARTINSSLALTPVVINAGFSANTMNICADTTGSSVDIYGSFFQVSDLTLYAFVANQALNVTVTPTAVDNTSLAPMVNIAMTAQNGVCTIMYQINSSYSYGASTRSDITAKNTITRTGTVGTLSVVMRSVGIASKGFLYNGVMYALVDFFSAYQPTYFLIDSDGNIYSKLAYSNGSNALQYIVPSATVVGNKVYIAYLIKDLIQSVSKNTSTSNTAGIYSQTGINLATFNLAPTTLISSEIASNLNLSGGFLWNYDGLSPVENNFFVWPDNTYATWSATGGSIVAKPDGSTNTNAYYYVATYEWSDNNGNVSRSAPSIPYGVTTTGAGSAGSIVVKIPTLRITKKTENPVKIVIYRWSVAQQNYYQVTSITSPVLNDTTVDNISFTDTQADASILGNNLLYTTGGVIENIGPPATDNITLYKSRLFLVDAEDRNLLWYSKQVIEATPVEMSDLFTIYVAPTTAAQGNTGPITALSAMDDKLIIFKKNAIYYITGNGPDNTGANNDFSEPVFITGTVGCTNQQSIVFMPNGLMFQSDKGIWLLGRDLSTTYIGAPVEGYNTSLVNSSVTVPGTNEVRFTLDSGITLMYDYFQGQWGTFTGVPAVSSTLFEDLHTFINESGNVLQETPGLYLDGTNPVNMSFTTGWINMAGLQGFQRAYSFFLLGTYLTPHKLQLQIGYDYNSSPTQTTFVYPDNYSGVYGSDPLYGNGSPYGGPAKLEQWEVYLQRQKCESFQITLKEIYDPSFGVPAGAGLTLSGLNMTVGIKSGSPQLKASWSVG